MKIVIDSSVLIAAYISEEGACAKLLEEVLMHHDLVLSNFIIDEVTRKLSTKFRFSDDLVVSIRESIANSCSIVEPSDIPADVCRDPNDIAVLGTAVSAGAQALITVDNDLLVLQSYAGIRIQKPGEFLRSQPR